MIGFVPTFNQRTQKVVVPQCTGTMYRAPAFEVWLVVPSPVIKQQCTHFGIVVVGGNEQGSIIMMIDQSTVVGLFLQEQQMLHLFPVLVLHGRQELLLHRCLRHPRFVSMGVGGCCVFGRGGGVARFGRASETSHMFFGSIGRWGVGRSHAQRLALVGVERVGSGH